MRTLFLVLLIADLLAGGWLWLQGPVDQVREPGRLELQVEPGRVRVLTEAELARLRLKAESDAAAQVSGQATAPAPAVAAPAAESPAPTTAGGELPLASCVDIGDFPSEAAARKLRTRLAAAGLDGHVATATSDKLTRLRITELDAAGEAQLHAILRDFPKQELTHCSEAPLSAPARSR